MNSLQQDWLSNIRNDLLAGLAVALALIPRSPSATITAEPLALVPRRRC
jgi:SulP family sulfate permease